MEIPPRPRTASTIFAEVGVTGQNQVRAGSVGLVICCCGLGLFWHPYKSSFFQTCCGFGSLSCLRTLNDRPPDEGFAVVLPGSQRIGAVKSTDNP